MQEIKNDDQDNLETEIITESEQEFEDKIKALISDLPEELNYLGRYGNKSLLISAMEEMDLSELKIIKEEIEKFIEERNRVLIGDSKSGFEINNYNKSLEQDNINTVCQLIDISESNPDAFLGNGSVAEVYEIMGMSGKCVKIVKNQERYQEGNNIHKEAEFLINLNNFEVAGVKTPEPYAKISSLNLTALIMEKLNAVNFRHVLEGKVNLPERFNFKNYFDALKEYLEALHNEKEIYHNDFLLRNLMIDIESGDPRVIDFGKSVFRHDIMGEDDRRERILAEDDVAGLAAAKAEVRTWLESKDYKV